MISCFVTGTDTGVGKTLASCSLLRAFARNGHTVIGMKPVAAGAQWRNGAWTNEDVVALRAASNVTVPGELDNPVLLPDPMSPHLAAERAAVRIDIAEIVRRHRLLATRADAVVVEGAGGFLVPLSCEETGGDMARALGLPVVLVVGLRLGCLNHSLLTAQAIRARGLQLAGWVASRIDPEMRAADENVAYLRSHLRAPLLADIPYLAQPDSSRIELGLPPAWNRRTQ